MNEMRFKNRVALSLWKATYRPLYRRAVAQILKGRLLDDRAPFAGRWLETDVKEFLKLCRQRTDQLLHDERLDDLPNFGNRHNVFLAAMTTASYQVLLERNLSQEYARTLTADVGWKIYAWMLQSISLPFRLFVRDPGKRMEKTLRMMIIFPFSAPGAPGYEVKVHREGDDTHTHWTHCPPQTFVRRLSEMHGDHGELDAFFHSWCQYDWPGADILANDGLHGHYSRPHALSRGDKVCDMCWHGRVR